MNFIQFIFTYIGIVAVIFGFVCLIAIVVEFFSDLRGNIRECRDAIRRLEEKR